MTSSSPTPPSRSVQALKTILYILAGIVLALGLVTGISLIASAGNLVSGALMPLQLLGGGAIFNMIAPMLSGLLINLCITILIAAIILSTLLFAVARLLGRILLFEARLADLEARE
jgi:hypothetical protein